MTLSWQDTSKRLRYLADEGVEFDKCGPDTHRLHYEKLVTDASRERGGAVGGGDETNEELPEGETHGMTLLGWGAARRHVHHVAAGPCCVRSWGRYFCYSERTIFENSSI